MNNFNPEKPLDRAKGMKQTQFTKGDIPGETARSVRKLIMLAVFLALFWFVRECYYSWDIFS